MTLAKPDKPITTPAAPEDINPKFLENAGFKRAIQSYSHSKILQTLETLGAHEHEGWLVYQEPTLMKWHMVAPDGSEPLGVATHRHKAHRIVSDHNRYESNQIKRSRIENEQTTET